MSFTYRWKYEFIHGDVALKYVRKHIHDVCGGGAGVESARDVCVCYRLCIRLWSIRLYMLVSVSVRVGVRV
jgi:hypothetical protein